MRKIIAIHHLSLDGVMQGPGGAKEDPSHGFDRGGWTMPYDEPVIGKTVMKMMNHKFDLLLGRHTYDIWTGYWPKHGDNPIGAALNRCVKYVATRRPRKLAWANSEHLDGDVVKKLRALKKSKGPEIHAWGSAELMQTLLAAGLVDEVRLWVYPVIVGKGKRLFDEGLPMHRLKLVRSQSTPSGILLNSYRPKPIPHKAAKQRK